VHGDPNADPTGAPIMVIHGFIVSGHESLMPWAVDKLSERALILPDLMGYGYSARDTKPGNWSTPKSHARYLAAMLDRTWASRKSTKLRHAPGEAATIAAQFALDYPQRVRRIVFISPGLYIERSATEVLIQWPVLGRAMAWHMIGGGPLSFVGRRCRNTPDCPSMSTETSCAATRSARLTTSAIAALERSLRRHPAPHYTIYGAMGRKGRMVPRSVAERLSHDAHAELVVLPNAWHMPWIDQPDEVARRVLDFLRTP
jgi:pimeloyl-ACP methyl ester carboxylesterase